VQPKNAYENMPGNIMLHNKREVVDVPGCNAEIRASLRRTLVLSFITEQTEQTKNISSTIKQQLWQVWVKKFFPLLWK
jgi:hypothetical protein